MAFTTLTFSEGLSCVKHFSTSFNYHFWHFGRKCFITTCSEMEIASLVVSLSVCMYIFILILDSILTSVGNVILKLCYAVSRPLHRFGNGRDSYSYSLFCSCAFQTSHANPKTFPVSRPYYILDTLLECSTMTDFISFFLRAVQSMLVNPNALP